MPALGRRLRGIVAGRGAAGKAILAANAAAKDRGRIAAAAPPFRLGVGEIRAADQSDGAPDMIAM